MRQDRLVDWAVCMSGYFFSVCRPPLEHFMCCKWKCGARSSSAGITKSSLVLSLWWTKVGLNFCLVRSPVRRSSRGSVTTAGAETKSGQKSDMTDAHPKDAPTFINRGCWRFLYHYICSTLKLKTWPHNQWLSRGRWIARYVYGLPLTQKMKSGCRNWKICGEFRMVCGSRMQ